MSASPALVVADARATEGNRGHSRWNDRRYVAHDPVLEIWQLNPPRLVGRPHEVGEQVVRARPGGDPSARASTNQCRPTTPRRASQYGGAQTRV